MVIQTPTVNEKTLIKSETPVFLDRVRIVIVGFVVSLLSLCVMSVG